MKRAKLKSKSKKKKENDFYCFFLCVCVSFLRKNLFYFAENYDYRLDNNKKIISVFN